MIPRFQSAPRAEARGDPKRDGFHGVPVGFNPRPAPKRGAIRIRLAVIAIATGFNPRPAPKRGAIQRGGCEGCKAPVSIRAPRRSAGRWFSTISPSDPGSFNPRPAPKRGAITTIAAMPAHSLFQSAPRAEARGDPTRPLLPRLIASFNPRPAPKRGAIPDKYSRTPEHEVSIRAPRRSAGRSQTPQLAGFNEIKNRQSRGLQKYYHELLISKIQSQKSPFLEEVLTFAISWESRRH